MSDTEVLFDCGTLKFIRRGDELYATVNCESDLLRKAAKAFLKGTGSEGGEFKMKEIPNLTTVRDCVQALAPERESFWDSNTLTPASDAIHFLEKIPPASTVLAENVVLVSTVEERDEWPGTCWMLTEPKEESEPTEKTQTNSESETGGDQSETKEESESEDHSKSTEKSETKEENKSTDESESTEESESTNEGESANDERGENKRPMPDGLVFSEEEDKRTQKWNRMCCLMNVIRSMLDASYQGSNMQNVTIEELPHPVQFFYDNWPNFSEAQLSALLRMSVLGHFARICEVKNITVKEFKQFYTTDIELSDCDIAYILVQALRSMNESRDTPDDKLSPIERAERTLFVFTDEFTVFRQFKVKCTCPRGKRIDFVIELLRLLMTKRDKPDKHETFGPPSDDEMKSKGSLTFQSLVMRLFDEQEKKPTPEREEKFLAYALSVFFEACISDVVWPTPEIRGVAPAAVAAAAAAAPAAGLATA